MSKETELTDILTKRNEALIANGFKGFNVQDEVNSIVKKDKPSFFARLRLRMRGGLEDINDWDFDENDGRNEEICIGISEVRFINN
jgi:hypothetical protein